MYMYVNNRLEYSILFLATIKSYWYSFVSSSPNQTFSFFSNFKSLVVSETKTSKEFTNEHNQKN